MSEQTKAAVHDVARVGGATREASTRAGWALMVLVILGLSLFLALEVPRISRITASHTDFIETVYGLRAFWSGQDPYGDAVAAQVDALLAGHPVPAPPGGHYEHPFDYALPPGLLYSPVVVLPDEPAVVVVRALTVALYLTAWLALVWRFATRLPAAARAAAILLGLAWWPFLSVILPIVQQAGTVFALLVLATLAAERGHWGWAGAAAFVALLKPTESLPVVAMLGLMAWCRPPARRPFLTGLLAVGVPTSLMAFARRPTWISDWVRTVASLHAGHFGYVVDNLATLAGFVHLPAIVLYALASLASGVTFWLAWRAVQSVSFTRSGEPEQLREALWWWLGVSCLLTLLFVPRTGAYDMVITLIPWSVALGACGTLSGPRRSLATAGLLVVLAGAGLLAYRDHGALELPFMALALTPALWLCRPDRWSETHPATPHLEAVAAAAGTGSA